MEKEKLSIVDDFIASKSKSLLEHYSKLDIPAGEIGNRVWFFWYTGIENVPEIVKKCYDSVRKMKGADVILIDQKNIYDICIISSVIIQKFRDGLISIQTFSDILRARLISEHGGFWFDATIFVLDSNFLEKHSNKNFYAIRLDPKVTKHFSNGFLI